MAETSEVGQSSFANGGEKRAELSRELSEFLIDLAIGVHRYAMYPPEHPSLGRVAENMIARLAQLFLERHDLSIGVARERLVIEGLATESKHPVLSDLARRLHGHMLGAISFTRGTRVQEMGSLLETLAQDPERGGAAPGTSPAAGAAQLATRSNLSAGVRPSGDEGPWLRVT